MVNVGEVINTALTKTTGSPARSNFVKWFKEVAVDILMQPRYWKCLEDSGIEVGDDYADNQTTAFPDDFFNLFVTGLRMHHYDGTKDGRYSKEVSLYEHTMSQVKAYDNSLKKTGTAYESHGYVRQTS